MLKKVYWDGKFKEHPGTLLASRKVSFFFGSRKVFEEGQLIEHPGACPNVGDASGFATGEFLL